MQRRVVRLYRTGFEQGPVYTETPAPPGWGLSVGLIPSHRKNSVVLKTRERGGHDPKTCRNTVEKEEEMTDGKSIPCVIWGRIRNLYGMTE